VTKQMVNGYVPDLEESNWKAGFETLKSLNSSVYQGVYPNGNQAVLDLLGKGQIWVAPVWSDQALTAMKQGLLGPSNKLTQIKNPSFTGGAAYLGVPKTARSKRDVYAFVNYILSVKAQTQIVNVMSGYPAIDVKYLNANLKKKFADVDANVLRQAYSSKMQNDLKAQWQQTVP
jgi:putative spermidine/putrescine transport system substrate-binding protein